MPTIIPEDIKPYLDDNRYGGCLMPVVPGGKEARDRGWSKNEYNNSNDEIISWLTAKCNLAYRIPDHEIVIDLDPKNYNDEDTDEFDDGEGNHHRTENRLASFLGFDDFRDLLEWGDCPVVNTGGGGWHIYCRLPDGVAPKQLTTKIPTLNGVDIQRAGKYVVAAGSTHSSGKTYTWEDGEGHGHGHGHGDGERGNLDLLQIDRNSELMTLIIKPSRTGDEGTGAEGRGGKAEKEGWRTVTPAQLKLMLLDQLDPKDYGSNEDWFNLATCCHWVTGGEALEVFQEWSEGDPEYNTEEYRAKNNTRWESFTKDSPNPRTLGSLREHLTRIGREDIAANLSSISEFAGALSINPTYRDLHSEVDITSAEKKNVQDAVDSEIKKQQGLNPRVQLQGTIKEAIDRFPLNSPSENEKNEAIPGLIRHMMRAAPDERATAERLLTSNKIMTQAQINRHIKLIKEEYETSLDSVPKIVSNVVLKSLFNNGRHIIVEADGGIYTFKGTHWSAMSTDHLKGKLQYAIDQYKVKANHAVPEVSAADQATQLIRSQVAVSGQTGSKLFNLTRQPDKIINCINKEVWIDSEGKAVAKKHNYKSYQISRINVEYDEWAECPLFDETLDGIFSNHEDKDEMIQLLMEIIGYAIQPYKPLQHWIMFHGAGGDGKSTIIDILDEMLGEAAYNAQQSLLESGGSGSDTHETAALIGKRIILIDDTQAGKPFNDAGLKMLSSNKQMTANPKNLSRHKFKYHGTLFVAANVYPHIRDSSKGTSRRPIVFPFDGDFNGQGLYDPHRTLNITQSKTEMSGILNKALAAYRVFCKRGGKFHIPTTCERAKEQFLNSSNNVKRFVSDCIVVTNDHKDKILGTELFGIYQNWCSKEDVSHKGQNSFYTDLKSQGLKKVLGRTNQVAFEKIKLLDGNDAKNDFDDFDG